MTSDPFCARVSGEINVSIDIDDNVLIEMYGEANQDTLRQYIEYANFYLSQGDICDNDTLKCVGEVRWGYLDIESMDFDAYDLIESYTAMLDQYGDEVEDEE